MKPFAFRAESLLKLRQQREDQLRGAVQQALATTAGLESTLVAMRQSAREHQSAMSCGQGSPVHGAMARQLSVTAGAQQRAIENVQATLAQRRAQLLEAMRLRKAISRLKERQHQQYEQQQRRQAVKEWDDAYASFAAAGQQVGAVVASFAATHTVPMEPAARLGARS